MHMKLTDKSKLNENIAVNELGYVSDFYPLRISKESRKLEVIGNNRKIGSTS